MSLIAAFQGFFDTVESGAARARAAMADFTTSAVQSQQDAQEFHKAVRELQGLESVRINFMAGMELRDERDMSNADKAIAQEQLSRLRDAIDAARRVTR